MEQARPPGLTELQVDVAQAFFELPESAGFLLAGGAALVAQGLTARPTADLDIFTAPGRGDVVGAAEALARAMTERGYIVQQERTSATFARLFVRSGNESTAVDFAVDSTPGRPPLMSVAGPTLDPDELAGRKLVALFNRAAPRDFVDVFVLARRYGLERLVTLGHEADAGFDTGVLADMLGSIRRLPDSEIPADDPAAVRAFALDWAARLREGG